MNNGQVTDLVFNFEISTLVAAAGGEPIIVPSPSAGGAFVGRQKIAENSSPFPRDRVFVNYSHFDGATIARGGIPVNRFVPGFEKTFWDGLGSFEFRFPFASTLSSTIFTDAATDTSHLEFGNITAGLKLLLLEHENFAIAAGAMCALPTADDTVVAMANGTSLIEVENQAVNFLPYVGGVVMPSSRWFAQGFAQCDFQANSNNVRVNNGGGLADAGDINDPTLLYFDAAVGYWVVRNDDPGSRLRAVIPTAELHYNTTIESNDVVNAGGFRVGTFAGQIDTLNMVLGTTFLLGDNSRLGLAYVTPIGNSSDQQFDGEVRVTYDLFPSRPNRGRLGSVP